MRKRTMLLILGGALVVMIGIVFTVGQKGDVNMAITSKQAADLIQKEKNDPNFMILDVRTPAEYQSGAIAGAINIDFYAADFKTRLSQLDKNKKYLEYCRTGNRSAQAAAMMKELKIREVYDLSGGVVAWTQAGYPLVKP
jgi:rhodanese-related sulfurtransferase